MKISSSKKLPINTGPVRRLCLAIGAASTLALSTTAALADEPRHYLDIQPQNTDAALLELAEAAGVQIIFSPDIAKNTRSRSVQGNLTVSAALDTLLSGTNLTYQIGSDNVIEVREKSGAGSEEESEVEKGVDEEIIVTGSRIIRTPSQMPARMIVLDQDKLRALGSNTLEGALRQLPQNIFGATPRAAAVPNGGVSFNGALNVTGASSVNLRALGSEATLILVDGHRIGKSGVFGGVSDITGIPLRAVERVEIMLDGGASIYGSDAVGGVVNIITRKDFDGGEVNYEYAEPELGGFEQHVLTVNAGKSWGSGRVRATFERYQQSNLDGGERSENISFVDITMGNPAILTPFSNPFYRLGEEIFTNQEVRQMYTSSEIDGLRASGDLVLQTASLPPGHDGTNLTRDDLVYMDRINPIPLANGVGISWEPKVVRNNLQLGFDQELQLLGQQLDLTGSFYYSKRELYAAEGEFQFSSLVFPFAANSPLPNDFYSLGWSLPGFADRHYQTEEEVRRLNFDLDGEVRDNWRWRIAVANSWSEGYTRRFNDAISSFSTAYTELVNDGFNVFAGDLFAENSPELMQRLIADPWDSLYTNTESTLDAHISGGLLSLPGGDVFVSLSAGWRQEGLETGAEGNLAQLGGSDGEAVGQVPGSSIPRTDFEDVAISRTQRSSSVELLVPVVGTSNAIPGVQQFNFTGSARYDSYHEQGSDSTWTLGMTWSPIDQVMVRARRATGYVVPSFRDQLLPVRITDYTELSPPGLAYFLVDENNVPTGEMEYQALNISGGNPNLRPQTSRTSSAGIEFSPQAIPGLNLTVDWYQHEYIDRIGSAPRIEERGILGSDFGFGQTLLAGSGYDTKYGSSFFRREDGLLVRDTRAVNTAFFETAGFDYGLQYNRDTDLGRFDVTVNVSHPTRSVTAQNPGADPVNQLDDVSIRSKAVIPGQTYSVIFQWFYRGFSTSLSANTSSPTVSEDIVTSGIRPDGSPSSITAYRRTVDYPLNMALTLTYDTDQSDLLSLPTWLQGTSISLQIPDLLNDSTDSKQESRSFNSQTNEWNEWQELADLNANVDNPIGRMFHISISKRF